MEQSQLLCGHYLEQGSKSLSRPSHQRGIRVIDKVFHIQNVNSYHGRLHGRVGRFDGVATKYLNNYLSWFRFFESSDNPNETACCYRRPS